MTAPTSNSRTVGLDLSTGGMSLARLLFGLLRQRFTGTVGLDQAGAGSSAAGARTIWMRGGMPVYTDWQSEPDRLGEMLLTLGAIDPPMLERGLRALVAGNGLLGQIFVGLGAIDRSTLSDALRTQCARKLVHMFALRTGTVTVTAVDHAKGNGDELVAVNVLGLIFRGVVAHYDLDRIQLEMADALAGDMVATPALARYQRQFGFGDEDARVLATLGRGATLAGMLTPGMDRPRVGQIVYTLWSCQMLRVGQDAVEAIAKGATASSVDESPSATKPTAVQPPPAVAKPPPAPAKPPPAPAPKPAAAPPPPKPEPPKVEPAKPDDDGFDFLGQLGILEAKVQAEANAFEMFSLPVEADRPEIRAVWAELSKRFHPDALEAQGRSDLRERVEKVFAALSEAYGVLSDKVARAQLAEAIHAGGSGIKAGDDTSKVVRNAFEAELIARDADKLLRASSWDRARDMFARAHELSPSDPDIEAAWAYARHMASTREMTDIRIELSNLARIIEHAPGCSRAYYFAGMIHMQLGEVDAAKLRFMDALRQDPRNVDAERQLRALKIKARGGAGPDAPGKKEDKKPFGLRGLFGKK